MTFSGAVRITDLSDYIAPSQSCVVTLNGQKKTAALEVHETSEIQLQPRAPVLRLPAGPKLPGPPPKEGDPVKVSLHDCLACSGCVTTAETMLLEQQSVQEFLSALAQPDMHVVVSIAPQSRAALAALHGVGPYSAWLGLVSWLTSLGVRHVLDLTTARDISLLESAAEFIHRFRSAQQASSAGLPSISDGSHQQMQQLSGLSHALTTSPSSMDVDGADSNGGTVSDRSTGPLPVMASACPGWVCYAEKTQGEVIIPHMSTVKSPQAVMGTLVKRFLAERLGCDPAKIYHTSVMPCYDKKLEASREEFTVPGGQQLAEVDCCLTTIELHDLMVQKGVTQLTHITLLPPSAAQGSETDMEEGDQQVPVTAQGGAAADGVLIESPQAPGHVWGLPGSGGSGGYMDFVFRVSAAELFGVAVPAGPLPLRQLRNSDFQEVELLDAQGGVLLRFARVNGFRNIQTLMRQIKAKRCQYHYVEVMACPSGCLNGGGQLKPSAGQTPAQVLQAVEAAYEHQEVSARLPLDNPAVLQLYGGWVQGAPGSEAADRVFHTTYRQRNSGLAGGTRLVTDW